MKHLLVTTLLFCLILGAVASPAHTAPLPPEPTTPAELSAIPAPGSAGAGQAVPIGATALPAAVRLQESEPNDTRALANALPPTAVYVLGNVFPNADVDYYSFNAGAGSRVYAAIITSFSATGGGDSVLSVLNSAGVVIEMDDNDGSFGGTSSSIAGALLPAAGTYYLEVKHVATNTTIRPYTLYVKVQSGALVAEVEPNNEIGTATPLPGGWASGTIGAINDKDYYSLALNAGDTVFLSLDLDPERDATTWNGVVGLGPIGGFILVVNDANTVSPNSEAFVITVKTSGTYYAYVTEAASGVGSTYHLSASVIPPETPAGTCTTYTNTTPLALADNGSSASSITITSSSGIIADLDVAINLNHDYMPDLDLTLTAPGGNVVGLFNDIGGSGSIAPQNKIMDLVLDDEAAIPFAFTIVSGLRLQPEYAERLSWFDGQTATGTWTLTLADDTATNTGTLNSWSLTVCQPAPLPACRNGFTPKLIYFTNFEANNAGFTSSGTANEWEWGTPTFAPITTCSSGIKCWKTDLDNTYDVSSSQDLTSPTIDLTQYAGPVMLNWLQKFQMEAAQYDHANVSVFEASDGIFAKHVWEWMDATMTFTQGAASIQESAGWGAYTRDISAYAGKKIQVRYHLDSDVSGNFSGLAVDDISITACVPSLYLPTVLRMP